MINIKTSKSKVDIEYKTGAFADDVGVICGADTASVNGVFRQYERLTNRSGLVLNAEKTEILSLTNDRQTVYDINYNGSSFKITTIKEVKVCGIWFCNNQATQYKLNITDKITKMECMLRKWKSRHLTFEGKSLLIKTFGLSQLIYNLQVCEINKSCIKTIERSIFGFIWASSNSDKEKGIDRIKRAVMKNEPSEGGLNISDIECLDKSLKLRRFIGSSRTNHPIARIQTYCMEQLGQSSSIKQEYSKISDKEGITKSAQQTINDLCDFARKTVIENHIDAASDQLAVGFISSTNISTYLNRKNKKMLNCMFRPLKREGIETLSELCTQAEIEQDNRQVIRIGNILATFPVEMLEVVAAYNENTHDDSENLSHICMGIGIWIDINIITTRERQNPS